MRFGKTLALGSVAAYGFTKGVGSQGLTEDFYNLTTGNPNIDKEVLGTDLSLFDMMAPLPGPSRMDMAMGRVPGFRSGVPRMIASLNSGFLNGRTFSDARAKHNTPFDTYANNYPVVNGDIVFGAYNSRFG